MNQSHKKPLHYHPSKLHTMYSLKQHSIFVLLLSIFLLSQPCISTDILAPLLSPFIDGLCKNIACGKGECKTGTNYTLGYTCECEDGWKQVAASADDDEHLGFLPCVIPNCTVDYSCTKAQTPAPQLKDPPKNASFFDVCNWAYCGEGSCKKSASNFGYNCECQQGAANLMNTTTFPCFNECSLGADCTNLGLNLTNMTSVSPPALPENSDNHANSVLPGKIFWMMVLIFTLSATTWI